MATCPACQRRSRDDDKPMSLRRFYSARPIGTYSIAGKSPKALVKVTYRLECVCGWSVEGHVQGSHFIGDPATQSWPVR